MSSRIYPGNGSTVKDLTEYIAAVSQDNDLPRVLAPMTAAVELTAAFTSEGNLEDIPGFLNNVDHCSVGIMQQQADDLGCGYFGWGTYEQCIDVPYAVQRFCDEAKKWVDDEWNADTTDPYLLGDWCAWVQKPAAEYEHRYRTVGLPIIQGILTPLVDEWPQTTFAVTDDGWCWVPELRTWLRGPADQQFSTDAGGWGYSKLLQETWSWPEAWDPPRPGDYQDRHPTRYNWRADVGGWARWLVDEYPGRAWCNTYYDHPEGYGRDSSSFDVWDYQGRNYDIDPGLGDEIFSILMKDPGEPNIEWIIWRETIYGAWNGWDGEPFGDGSKFEAHNDHVHVTYR